MYDETDAEEFERWYLAFELLSLDLVRERVASALPGLRLDGVQPFAREFIRRWPDGAAAVPPDAKSAAVLDTLRAMDAQVALAGTELRRFVRNDFAAMPFDFVSERGLLTALWSAAFRPGRRSAILPETVRVEVLAAVAEHVDPELWEDLDRSLQETTSEWDRRRAEELENRLGIPRDLNPLLEPLRGTLEVLAARCALRSIGKQLDAEQWSVFLAWVSTAVEDGRAARHTVERLPSPADN